MEDFNELKEMLVRGSDEINRMKREIKIVTDLISGLIKPGDFGPGVSVCSRIWYYGGKNYRGSTWYDSTTDGQWEIDLDDNKDKIKFFGHNNPRAFNSFPDSTLLYSGRMGVSLGNVETVYSALPAFIQGVFEVVPDMRCRIQPYGLAAKHSDSHTSAKPE